MRAHIHINIQWLICILILRMPGLAVPPSSKQIAPLPNHVGSQGSSSTKPAGTKSNLAQKHVVKSQGPKSNPLGCEGKLQKRGQCLSAPSKSKAPPAGEQTGEPATIRENNGGSRIRSQTEGPATGRGPQRKVQTGGSAGSKGAAKKSPPVSPTSRAPVWPISASTSRGWRMGGSPSQSVSSEGSVRGTMTTASSLPTRPGKSNFQAERQPSQTDSERSNKRMSPNSRKRLRTLLTNQDLRYAHLPQRPNLPTSPWSPIKKSTSENQLEKFQMPSRSPMSRENSAPSLKEIKELEATVPIQKANKLSRAYDDARPERENTARLREAGYIQAGGDALRAAKIERAEKLNLAYHKDARLSAQQAKAHKEAASAVAAAGWPVASQYHTYMQGVAELRAAKYKAGAKSLSYSRQHDATKARGLVDREGMRARLADAQGEREQRRIQRELDDHKEKTNAYMESLLVQKQDARQLEKFHGDAIRRLDLSYGMPVDRLPPPLTDSHTPIAPGTPSAASSNGRSDTDWREGRLARSSVSSLSSSSLAKMSSGSLSKNSSRSSLSSLVGQ